MVHPLHSVESLYELSPNNVGELKPPMERGKNDKIFIKHPA